MTRAEDLLQALNALRQAAGAGLSGEAREAALQRIKSLFQLAGFDGEDTGEGADVASVPLSDAISAVRSQAEGELSGNAFQLAAKSLDDIAALAGAAEPVPEHSEPAHPEPVHPDQQEEAVQQEAPPPAESFGPGFDALSQASKARVDAIGASLGIPTHIHHASPLHAKHYEAPEEHHETAAAEEAVNAGPPPATEETPASAEVLEPQSAREVAEATHDFGTPALATGEVPEYAAPHKEEEELEAEAFTVKSEPVPFTPEPQAPAPETFAAETAVSKPAASDSAAAPAVATVQKIETLSKEKENQEHPEKTLFSLWLDMLFGRKK